MSKRDIRKDVYCSVIHFYFTPISGHCYIEILHDMSVCMHFELAYTIAQHTYN